MNEYYQLYLPIILSIGVFIIFFLEDSGDDDDQGGGLMQPAYLSVGAQDK